MQLTSETYVAEVLRTDCPITPELIERLSQSETIRLLHATKGRELDLVNAAEEVGDSQWYAGLACLLALIEKEWENL